MLLQFTITMRGAAKAFPAPRSIKPSPIPLTERKRKVHRRTDTDSVYTMYTVCATHVCYGKPTPRERKKERGREATSCILKNLCKLIFRDFLSIISLRFSDEPISFSCHVKMRYIKQERLLFWKGEEKKK